VGSGGLYNNQNNPSEPLVCADHQIGEWNTFRIKMVGERVTVFLNDALVLNNVVLENYWDRGKPIYPAGPIELQNHGNTLWFRNVFVREFPRIGAVTYEDDPGFVSLFDGTQDSLDKHWQVSGNPDAWLVEDGVLKTIDAEHGAWLRTAEQFGDFVLRLEWMVPEHGNSGVGLRWGETGGPEIQILAPWHP